MKKEKYCKVVIKYVSKLGIFLSAFSLSLGIIYFFLPTNSILYDLFGFVLIFSWLLNGALVYFTDIYLNKNFHIGKQINRLSYYYLALFIASILLLVFGIIFSAFIISGPLLVLGNIMIVSGFLITNLYGFHFCIVTFTNIDNRGAWTFE
ncbi:MAG: hypothetical protein KGD68_11460 [Candidatus Lokiarchaeota archaeon]|nr:hypothetical protein [Candidatus Lokiarchaeota archaeon]